MRQSIAPGVWIDHGPCRMLGSRLGGLRLADAVPVATEPDLLPGVCRHGHVGEFVKTAYGQQCHACRIAQQAAYRAGVRKVAHPCERCGQGMARTRYCSNACRMAARRGAA